MTIKEKNRKAQDLIMKQISSIGYGSNMETYIKEIGDEKEAYNILSKQMNRVAKMFGYEEAWFS